MALIALAVAVLLGAMAGAPASERLPSGAAGARPSPVPSAPPGSPIGPTMLVQVGGAVTEPGVYSLAAGSRVIDAVAAASGLAADADTDGVNLVRMVADGEHLHVPRVGEAAESASTTGEGVKLDLNRAGPAELDALPRVGPALAQRIVDYREQNGPFGSVDELQSVAGIGDAILAGLRDLVTV